MGEFLAAKLLPHFRRSRVMLVVHLLIFLFNHLFDGERARS